MTVAGPTMQMSELITPDQILDQASFADKSSAIRQLASRAGELSNVSASTIEQALNTREALGSTGVGQGIAIPHARIEGLSKFLGVFARLAKPIDFASVDGKPSDLIFLLLIPSNAASQQVAALALISRRLRDKAVLEAMRAASGRAELYQLLIGP